MGVGLREEAKPQPTEPRSSSLANEGHCRDRSSPGLCSGDSGHKFVILALGGGVGKPQLLPSPLLCERFSARAGEVLNRAGASPLSQPLPFTFLCFNGNQFKKQNKV